jgi:hypothetical protein
MATIEHARLEKKGPGPEGGWGESFIIQIGSKRGPKKITVAKQLKKKRQYIRANISIRDITQI